MQYDGIKLVYFDGKPQWRMPDGSFVPVKRPHDGLYAPGSFYVKDRGHSVSGKGLIVP
jgi:hypothetical protein